MTDLQKKLIKIPAIKTTTFFIEDPHQIDLSLTLPYGGLPPYTPHI